ncbi:MAG: M48 family metallopeptidase [Kiritimatiellae bacterium]|nr:M48 family metallopeptidase [Kiritimatiellia bacterium]
MTFFARQEAARRKTRVLLAYYMTAVMLIVCAFYFASRAITALALASAGSRQKVAGELDGAGASFPVLAWDPFWMLVTAGVSLAVIGGGTLFRRASLAEGGAAVARSAGGREINPSDNDGFLERRLLNIVEEVALASGIPVPRVFVLEDEPGINAFASGFSLRDSAVAVTRGALERLSREELHGVVAHEFSHIKNGDMRLNSWLLGILFGILVTSIAGRFLMHSLRFVRVSRNRKGGGGGLVLVVFLSGLALWVIGSVGILFARLIQASVSRQREFLADASAVQFTRNPAGLAGALKRIGASGYGSAMRCANRSELSHMLFSSGTKLSSLFSSHPPILTRVLQLDPEFTGDFAPWQRQRPQAEAKAGKQEHAGAAVDTTGLSAFTQDREADLPVNLLPGIEPGLLESLSRPL